MNCIITECGLVKFELARQTSGPLNNSRGNLHCSMWQEQELSEQRLQVDIPALEKALKSFGGEKRKLDERVGALQQELGKISQQSGVRGALEAFRRDRRAKDEQYQNE